ncbi:DUF998 domain-containing protein [Altererythrobacter sp.]|nr:DUF998 domain-containing protein [Altererythrobacter sp.]
MNDLRYSRIVWLAGPAAAAMFVISVTGFAAMRRDGYSHATKAVSELGSTDAPLALAFNLLALIMPGMLVIAFSVALLGVTKRNVGPCLLIVSGSFLILSGLAPAELDNYEATTTLFHVIGAMGTGLFWTLGLFWVGPLLRDQLSLSGWGTITPWFGLFMVANIGWQIAFNVTGSVLPGWGQRIGFLGYFLWFATTGFLLWRNATTTDEDVQL